MADPTPDPTVQPAPVPGPDAPAPSTPAAPLTAPGEPVPSLAPPAEGSGLTQNATPGVDPRNPPPIPDHLVGQPVEFKRHEGVFQWVAKSSASRTAIAAFEKAKEAFEKATGWTIHAVKVPHSHFAEIVDGRAGLPVPTQARLAAGPLKIADVELVEQSRA